VAVLLFSFKDSIFVGDELSLVATKYHFNLDTMNFEEILSDEELLSFKSELDSVSGSELKSLLSERVDIEIALSKYVFGYDVLITYIEAPVDPCVFLDDLQNKIAEAENLISSANEYNSKLLTYVGDKNVSTINVNLLLIMKRNLEDELVRAGDFCA
jgi:hypothetical protein